MSHTRSGIATYGRPYITVFTGNDRRITFLSVQDFRRYKAGTPPKGYRPTTGQRRYSRAELRRQLIVLRGGKSR